MKTIEEFRGEYRWLSNFWPVVVMDEYGLKYPTVEHAYQASKFPKDHPIRDKIHCTARPGTAKKLGRTPGQRPDWDQVKETVMYKLLKQKFAPNTELASLLLGTGKAEIIEGNTWGDQEWGVCRGQGKNKMGKLLMRIREELRCESSQISETTTILHPEQD